jgi:hypothetical protein
MIFEIALRLSTNPRNCCERAESAVLCRWLTRHVPGTKSGYLVRGNHNSERQTDKISDECRLGKFGWDDFGHIPWCLLKNIRKDQVQSRGKIG